MGVELSQVKDTIRKLLNLAKDDAATEGEINNAMRFAQRLMTAHHLTEEDLGQDRPVHKMEMGTVYASGARADAWEHGLVTFVSEFMGSVGAFNQGKTIAHTPSGVIQRDSETGQEKCRITFVFYGIDEEVQLARDLYNTLSETIIAMALLKHGNPYRNEGRDYAHGFVAGLRTQLQKNRQELLTAESNSTALVLRSDKAALAKLNTAKTWLAQDKGIRLHKSSTRLTAAGSGNAFADGHNDGKRAEVKPNRTRRLGNS